MNQPPADTAERIHALITLYRESHYDVEFPDGSVATMRIGRTAPDAVQRWIGADRIAYYVTACNPRSQSLPREENEQRLESLRAHLRARDYAFLEGAGHIPGEAWREHCLFVRGIGETEIGALVRKYEQNSIVVAYADAPTLLRLYRPEWRGVVGEGADVEWA
jgi:Protein of unknown function (DUF3293)